MCVHNVCGHDLYVFYSYVHVICECVPYFVCVSMILILCVRVRELEPYIFSFLFLLLCLLLLTATDTTSLRVWTTAMHLWS